MKIRQVLYITNPEKFLRHDYENCLNIFGSKTDVEGWIEVGEIEVDVNVDSADVVGAMLAEIIDESNDMMVQLNGLIKRRRDILALTNEAQS